MSFPSNPTIGQIYNNWIYESEGSWKKVLGIAESGSNTNGKYVKFLDGTMIVYLYHSVSRSFTVATPTAPAGPTCAYVTYPWIFPATFYSAPSVFCNGDVGWGPALESHLAYGATTLQCTVEMVINSSTAATLTANENLIAIGRWKE